MIMDLIVSALGPVSSSNQFAYSILSYVLFCLLLVLIFKLFSALFRL